MWVPIFIGAVFLIASFFSSSTEDAEDVMREHLTNSLSLDLDSNLTFTIEQIGKVVEKKERKKERYSAIYAVRVRVNWDYSNSSTPVTYLNCFTQRKLVNDEWSNFTTKCIPRD